MTAAKVCSIVVHRTHSSIGNWLVRTAFVAASLAGVTGPALANGSADFTVNFKN